VEVVTASLVICTASASVTVGVLLVDESFLQAVTHAKVKMAIAKHVFAVLLLNDLKVGVFMFFLI
jgi:hypothetical protein